MQVYNSESDEFGPVLYCHHSGSAAPSIVYRLKERMQSRGNDLEYASARLVQEAIDNDPGALSFGIWNTDHLLTAADSHGDAGVVLIDCADGFKATYLGGYLK